MKIILALGVIMMILPFLRMQKAYAGEQNQVRASHILVQTKEEADKLKARIDKGEDFAKLAQEYSKCPSSRQGGDLGYFGHGVMVREFDEASFSLPLNKVSDPVKTQFGWHLILVTDKK